MSTLLNFFQSPMQRPDESAENKDSVAQELDIDRKRILPLEDELVTLKRQKKKIMDHNTTPYKRLHIALVNKVMAASKHSGRDFNQKAFRNKVCDYYQAIRAVDGHKARNEKWCHVLGQWLDGSVVKAAHLVPKSLISHIFLVSEKRCCRSQNGKLNTNILKYTANIRSSQGSHCTRRLKKPWTRDES